MTERKWRRRAAALVVKVLDPITGWCLRTEARAERYAEGYDERWGR